MTTEEADATLTREEMFRATVYAINSILIFKGIYSGEEFDAVFLQGAERQIRQRNQEASGTSPCQT